MNTKRIVITGANGFIGSSIVKNLIGNNYKNLLAIDKSKSDNEIINTIVGSFSDSNLLNQTLKKNDTIIHLACSTVPSLSESNREKDINENLLGTLKLLQTCIDKKINKFIYFSSGGTVYGDHGQKSITENDQTNPLNSHGIMKLAIEKYIQTFNRLYGLNYVIIRPSNPYGREIENNKNQGIIDIFLKKIIANENLEIWGDGNIFRDYIHINDLTNLITKIIEKDINNEIFNAGTGIGTSINEILKIIQEITEKKISTKYLDSREFDIKHNVLNIEKAKKILDWEPKISIKQGIKRSYNNLINKN